MSKPHGASSTLFWVQTVDKGSCVTCVPAQSGLSMLKNTKEGIPDKDWDKSKMIQRV